MGRGGYAGFVRPLFSHPCVLLRCVERGERRLMRGPGEEEGGRIDSGWLVSGAVESKGG